LLHLKRYPGAKQPTRRRSILGDEADLILSSISHATQKNTSSSQDFVAAADIAVRADGFRYVLATRGVMVGFWKRLFGREEPKERPRFGVVLSWPDPLPSEGESPAPNSADVQDAFYRLILGMPDSEVTELRPAEQLMLKRFEEVCGGERFDITTLPRLPEVLPQLLRLLKSEDADGIKVSKLVGRDPVLVGEVMRVSRSALYRTARPVSSLQHAVVLLGHDGLRRLVTMHVMKPILRSSAGSVGHTAGQQLWDHAERCAHACTFLGKGYTDSFEAYLAGVVSNAGVGAMIRVLNQEAPPTLGVFSREFLASFVRMAKHLTLRAAKHWELPLPVIDALREQLDILVKTPASELGNALAAADHVAMVQMLEDSRVIDHGMTATRGRVDKLPDALVDRALQDLRRGFREREAHVG
jgi:HD-like signal output (HDOD) protein